MQDRIAIESELCRLADSGEDARSVVKLALEYGVPLPPGRYLLSEAISLSRTPAVD